MHASGSDNQDLTGYVTKALYDAYSILMATDDDTPVAITIAAQQVIGRITGGAIKGLSVAEIKTLLGLATMAYETATDYVTKALFDADSILAATSDNTPAALVLTAQTLVGMITGGHPAALSVAQVKTMLAYGTMAAEAATDYIAKSLLTERGSIIFRDATGPAERLHGNDGDVLTSKGHGADPIFAAPTGGGGAGGVLAWLGL
jgi:hypothetical protein